MREPYIWAVPFPRLDLPSWHYDWVLVPLRVGSRVHESSPDRVYLGRWRAFPKDWGLYGVWRV